MMSTETSSEWLLRRKAELAAKDPNTKDKVADLHTEDKVAGLHTEDKVAGLHTEYKEEADKATNNGAEKVETQVVSKKNAGGTNETKRNPNCKTWLLEGGCCSSRSHAG